MKAIESVLDEELADVGIDSVGFFSPRVGVAVHHELRDKGLVGSEPAPFAAKIGDKAWDTRIREDLDLALETVEVWVGALGYELPFSCERACEAKLPYVAAVVEEFRSDSSAGVFMCEGRLSDEIEGVAG